MFVMECGLISKCTDKDFVSYACGFDFICFTETFLEKFDMDIFPGYKSFCKPAVKLSYHGRRSGGLVCLIKEEFVRFMAWVDVKYENLGVFLVNKSLLGAEKDVVIVCAYIQPEGSPFYNHFVADNGISILEECLTDCVLSFGDIDFIVCGDLNSRTANFSPDICADFACSVVPLESQPPCMNRSSCDGLLNNYGKLLLNLCTAFDLNIMNGLCQGDQQGCYTCIVASGSSVNDYFLVSNDFFSIFHDYCYMYVSDRIDSDHLPLEFLVYLSHVGNYEPDRGESMVCDKFVWNDDNALMYKENLCKPDMRAIFMQAMNLIDNDINRALTLFNDYIKSCAECMKKQMKFNKDGRNERRYDSECKIMKKNVQCLLRAYIKSLTNKGRNNRQVVFGNTGVSNDNNKDRSAFVIARREYKHLLERKRKMFNRDLLDSMIRSLPSQQDFWKAVKKVSFKNSQPRNTITLEKWHTHFKKLLDKNDDDDEDDSVVDVAAEGMSDGMVGGMNFDNNSDDHSDINCRITSEEVLNAMRKLKNNKAAGPDKIVVELFKYANSEIIEFFVEFFNRLFDTGLYPENWSESIILPLFKKGNINDPNNYRGISLMDVSCKLYSSIINTRLQEWVELNNITGEYQAGFKKGYCTVDHMFTLLAFIQKQFSVNRKFYVAFIDFQKAFDSVNRSILWTVLIKNGVKGKMLRCIQAMYKLVKSRVRSGFELTEYINCVAGVKQGDASSPVLFSLFINELALDVISNGLHGAHFSRDALELFILLLADDVLLLSETVVGLQRQLNSLCRAAESLDLKVNLDKSNIVVFRKGGYLAARESWTYNGTKMPVVNVYKYLGIYFSTRLSFNVACKDLASRGKKALLTIIKRLSILNNNSLGLFLKIFDSKIQPILLYGAEIWGLQPAVVHCEAVHLFALKRFLGVDKRISNDLVYGETKRYPLSISAGLRCIRYWLKLLQMESYRLPRKSYDMLFEMDAKGKKNWVSNVRLFLCENGFGEVWLNQGVGNQFSFLRLFRQRLIDCRWQRWNEHIQSSSRYDLYRIIASYDNFFMQPYLKYDLDMNLKRLIAKFRLGVSEIKTHQFRYREHRDSDLVCPLCSQSEENEVHFILCCPVLHNIRKSLIPQKYYREPCMFRLCILMSSTNFEANKKFGMYLRKAFKLRETLISKLYYV